MFNDIYRDKKVLVTGHTGFKGSWLSSWLLQLGAHVVGVSKDIPTKPSMFEEVEMEAKIKHYFEDIRELDSLTNILLKETPDFVFHLAAQPIVSTSYSDPIETISSNVMGTANVLEALKVSNHPCVAVVITSDKAYDNVEQVWGYKENDKMGGKDIYSGSKGAAELIIKSYFYSFFNNSDCNVKLGIGRAGNVIGGGDWAKDRIVVDCMEAWSRGDKVEIRSPSATRPWQHVLEPLSGYLNLGQALFLADDLNGEAFNFGPRAEQNHTVKQLLEDLSQYWDIKNPDAAFKITDNIPFHEAGLLKLNCDKALFSLKWQATLDYSDTIRFTSEWYYDFYKNENDIYLKTIAQINEYQSIAKRKGLIWTE
ncbi:CDP-glucose 4,6-dehydratase [Hydrogenovibrio sp. SC-1]|uniref:CDP-glucose 4,6-dehydratase n=1 Tax=Hydrogenovibrio sp. SC-1 TaxID=2065820 RepID=UPI000C7C3392|nr:CDP-glucose 4,6-dehydratase [Hydrogenovibrio sp. SC-1]PLA75550.1 CDP-glucose 4,6-dehydratase [Hydrogenovibrio sp. SC-1]